MTRLAKHRGLASIALLQLSENDLRSFHRIVSEMSPGSFLELIRDIEDEIDNSMTLTLDQATDRAFASSDSDNLYKELDQIRRTELRVPVQHFADLLVESLSQISNVDGASLPRFNSRRGLQAWITKLARNFSEQAVFHAAMRIRHEKSNLKDSDWKLR